MLETQQQAHQRRFSAARFADDCDVLTGTYLQRQIVDDKRHVFGIPERNVVQFDSAGQSCEHLFSVRNFGNGVEKGLDHI